DGIRDRNVTGVQTCALPISQNMAFGGRTHPEDLPAAESLYQDIIAGRQSFASLEIRVRHKLGEWRRIRFNFSPLADEKGNIEGRSEERRVGKEGRRKRWSEA